MATDGLTQLTDQRARRSGGRRLPPPRHPKADVAPSDVAPSDVSETPGRTQSMVPATSEVASQADVVGDPEPTEPTAGPPVAASATPEEASSAPRRRSRVRPTQVHLDEAAEEHLSQLRKRAVMADVDLTQSGVLRLALAELVDRYGYDRIVAMFAVDQPTIRRGRPRR